jgi:hypothetical protein
VQHPVTGVSWQVWLVVLQASVVQTLPSLHCALVVQQPATAANWQVWVVVLHVSVVQTFPSLHWALVVQAALP